VLNDFVFPYLTDSSIVAELGSGGGEIQSCFFFLIFCLYLSIFFFNSCFILLCSTNTYEIGRVAVQVSPRVQKLYCFDIAEEMIKHAKEALKDRQNVEFHLLHKPQFPTFLHNTLDFIYAFDVFPHIDLHTLWKVHFCDN
jgi:hypothetical protein